MRRRDFLKSALLAPIGLSCAPYIAKESEELGPLNFPVTDEMMRRHEETLRSYYEYEVEILDISYEDEV